ncbi:MULTISPECIES: TrbG/VirB9 family P-type conjugative transfer protein [Pseudomonas]|uniref:TrbG/VirB9 family P-type conjugative transfer protein n=1 Tax=Pseudomonas TaxID=286 RepID=UPI003FD6AC1F
MNRKLRISLALSAALLSSSAFAVSSLSKSPYDFRIKTAVYNPMDVVELDAVTGLSTHVVVAPDETYVTHVFGEEGGWTFTHKDNNFFFRPMAEMSDTNLTIVTNKRTYYFLLHYIGGKVVRDAAGKPVLDANGKPKEEFIVTPWSMKQATVGLIYKYPFEDMKAANKKLADRRVQEALNRSGDNMPVNISYQMSDEDAMRGISPMNVWDNFRFTTFKFQPNAELPTIWMVGSDGKETVANVEVKGANHNLIEAVGVAKMWKIRLGDKVVGVVNNGYNPGMGANSSGTSSPEVKRVLKNQGGEE